MVSIIYVFVGDKLDCDGVIPTIELDIDSWPLQMLLIVMNMHDLSHISEVP